MNIFKKINISPWILGALLLVVSTPLIMPYFNNGYFPTHDGEWAVVRLADMFRSLRDHQFPVRFSGSLNFGYGYPLFNFAYPLPYYLSIIFHFLKFSFVDSIKILFMLTVPISAIGMFLLSKKLWRSIPGALISSILYIYLPYRIVDLYVRGSIGEAVAFAIAPFLFFALYKVYEEKNVKLWIGLSAVLYAMLITSHNIMAVLFSIPLVVFSAFLGSTKRKIIPALFYSLLLGVMLSAFFTFPALFEKGNIELSRTPIADREQYFVNIPQLLNSPWGYGVPTDKTGAFTYQIGLPQLAIFLLTLIHLVFIYRQKNKKKVHFFMASVFAGTTVLMGMLLFSPSLNIWEYTPLLSEINYPWTLLGPIGFLICAVSGFIFSRKLNTYIAFILGIAAIFLVLPNAHPQSYVNRDEGFYMTNEATTTSSQELMPLWVKQKPVNHFGKKVEIVKGQGNITNIFYNSNKIMFDYDSNSKSVVRVNTIYYPGWKAFVNGVESKIDHSNKNGVMELNIKQGSSRVEFLFGETPLSLASDFISLGAFGVVLVLIFQKRIKNG